MWVLRKKAINVLGEPIPKGFLGIIRNNSQCKCPTFLTYKGEKIRIQVKFRYMISRQDYKDKEEAAKTSSSLSLFEQI